MGKHVRKSREVLRGLARQARQAPSQIVRYTTRGGAVRERGKSQAPKNAGAGSTTELLSAYLKGHSVPRTAAKALIAAAGGEKLRPSHVVQAAAHIARYAPNTKSRLATAMRAILRDTAQATGSKDLSGLVPRFDAARPRNRVATEEERDAIMRAAPPHLKLWLLLCSDLALRSGTAASIAPEHWDAQTRTIRCHTKRGAAVTLPATEEVSDLIAWCDLNNPKPFVVQLQAQNHRHGPQVQGTKNSVVWYRAQFAALRASLGIGRLIPHDLRRTTAVKVYEATGDAREVQAVLGHGSLRSTIHYLDHDLRPVRRSLLETIKRPARAEKRQA